MSNDETTEPRRDSDTVHGLVGPRIRFMFAWYDFWIGAYFDRAKETLYIFPIPMLGVRIDLRPRAAWICTTCGFTFRFRSCFMLHRATCRSNKEGQHRE